LNGLDWVGWGASAVLIATLGSQIYAQWQADDPEGVSVWLFLGQIAASVGFIVYSVSVESWVFVVTNSLILLTALAGQILFLVKRHDKDRGSGSN
jgi:MtN3 and saliva related transmembrane protein